MPRDIARRLTIAAAAVLILGAAPDKDKDKEKEADKKLPAGPTLHLADGGFAAGAPADSEGERCAWQVPGFVGPFEFPIAEVNAVQWPAPAKPPVPAGEYSFELSGGDVLFGSLVGLDEKTATLDVAHLGRVGLDRSRIARFDRWRDGSDLVYIGPNGLTGWKEPPPEPSAMEQQRRMGGIVRRGGVQPAPPPADPKTKTNPWRDDSGEISTSQPGAHPRRRRQAAAARLDRIRAELEDPARLRPRPRRRRRPRLGRARLPDRGLGRPVRRRPRRRGRGRRRPARPGVDQGGGEAGGAGRRRPRPDPPPRTG